MDGLVELYVKWTEVTAAFCNLENQPWQRFFHRSALCMRTIWYTNRCAENANVCLRGGTRNPWERSLAGFHISKASLGGNIVQKSPLITTYDIYKMRCFIWAHSESHYSQQIRTFRSDLFLLSATEQIALSLVITSYFFLNTSQMVKCQITSFWQPTQAFVNLFIPSASSIQHSLCYSLVFTTLLWPTAPIVMFNPMLPFSHCYFHGLQKMPLDSQLPRHQWLEMTMRPVLTGQEELLVWKAFLAFLTMW